MNKKKLDTNKALRDIEWYAKKFLKEEFGMELTIPIKINPRLKLAYGRFRSYERTQLKKSVHLEFSKEFIMYHPIEEIISTIKHECVHYALYELDKPYKDGELYFENYLKKVGADSSGTKSPKAPHHHYLCDKCGHSFTTINKRNYEGYTHEKCKGSKIVYDGYRVIEDKR